MAMMYSKIGEKTRETKWLASLGLAIGIGLGIASSFLVARALSGLLYGAGMGTPIVMLLTATVMVLVVVVASYLPARILSNTDPAVALRSE